MLVGIRLIMFFAALTGIIYMYKNKKSNTYVIAGLIAIALFFFLVRDLTKIYTDYTQADMIRIEHYYQDVSHEKYLKDNKDIIDSQMKELGNQIYIFIPDWTNGTRAGESIQIRLQKYNVLIRKSNAVITDKGVYIPIGKVFGVFEELKEIAMQE